MLFLVLVIFNGHITSRSIVPHVLGHFTLSSYVASPSSVGMDPSLLVPLGDLKQGGKVADLSPGHLLPPPSCIWATLLLLSWPCLGAGTNKLSLCPCGARQVSWTGGNEYVFSEGEELLQDREGGPSERVTFVLSPA